MSAKITAGMQLQLSSEQIQGHEMHTEQQSKHGHQQGVLILTILNALFILPHVCKCVAAHQILHRRKMSRQQESSSSRELCLA